VTLVVMAAGVGSRYGGFKQIDCVGPAGEMLLEYAVFDAWRAGFRRVVFIIRRELDQAFADLAAGLPPELEIVRVHQDLEVLPPGFGAAHRVKPWGTVHAVLAAREVIDQPFACVNADDFYGSEAYRSGLDACEIGGRENVSTVIGFPLHRTLSEHGPVVRAVCEVAEGWLTRIEELRGVSRSGAGVVATGREGERQFSGAEIASMNFWIFPPSIFEGLAAEFEAFLRRQGDDPVAELPLPDAVNGLVRRGTRVRVVETPGPWFGLTHREDRPAVSGALRALGDAGEYPNPLWGEGRNIIRHTDGLV
jgi:UTP-glucose-1-phosphate uridylyltransferase